LIEIGMNFDFYGLFLAMRKQMKGVVEI